jgi:2-hydroxy-3-keto-5-methylthiopentenyl-1-phosphate phosphatase
MVWTDVSSARLQCHVLVDFDGTIATVDTTDLLLERFADPSWTEIERAWKAGEIGSRECMLRQIDLVRATPEEIDAFVADIAIDPAFPMFVALCRGRGLDVVVVSDGLDRTVGSVLERHGLDLPFRANHLAWLGGDRWRLSFPHGKGDCRALAGNCKCQFALAPPGTVRIVVGDGRSDFCVAEAADLVLAKGALARHAAERRLAHFPIGSFAEATPLLARWLDEMPLDTGSGHDELRDK